VSSLQDFIKTIKRFRGELGEDLWFRGQANARHDLKPRTYRSSANYEGEAEDENRYDFQRRGFNFSPDVCRRVIGSGTS